MMNCITTKFEKDYENRSVTIHSKQMEVPIEKIIPYLNPEEFNAYCKNGCPNHATKWTCPPHCPTFENYSKDYSSISLHLFYIHTKEFEFLAPEIRAAQAYQFIKENLQEHLKIRESKNKLMIAANSCELCSQCNLVLGGKCHKPEDIRYNLTAFGFNVSGIMSDLLGHKLQWATENKIPELVSSVGAILIK